MHLLFTLNVKKYYMALTKMHLEIHSFYGFLTKKVADPAVDR